MPIDTVTPEKAEDLLLGRALKNLRESLSPKVTQSDAAARLDISLQAWQNYEAGKRRFTNALIDKVTAAIGVRPEDLAAERDRLLDEPPGAAPAPRLRDRAPVRLEIPIAGRARMGAQMAHPYDAGQDEGMLDLTQLLGSDARVLRGAGESMIPYAEPGGFVIYNLNRWPRRGQGCVIETTGGDYFVKRYDRTDGSTLFVTEFFPKERQITFPLTDVRGVYAIGLRGD
jgi:phage repressor protein C with HTH and peptisase S24 domain